MPRDKRRHANVLDVPGRAQDMRPILSGMFGSIFQVGDIHISTSPVNPAEKFGFGLWELYAEGRVLVGVDPTNPLFATAGLEGGEATHTLTCPEVPEC